MRIAVDIDDTLNVVERYKYASAYVQRKQLPFVCKDEHANAFVDVLDWTFDDVTQFLQEGGLVAFTDAAARPGAAETLSAWRQAGHEIVILTARQRVWFPNPEKISRDWLEKRGIPYDRIVAEVEDKGEYCAAHDIAVLVDDNVDKCLDAQRRGVAAVLFGGKHNRVRADEVYFGANGWRSADRAVRRIAHILETEEACARALPPRREELYDGWALRYDDCDSRALNSVRAFLPSRMEITGKLFMCEMCYGSENKPTRFHLTPLDGALDEVLSRSGYAMEEGVRCMTAPIYDLPESGAECLSLSEWVRCYRTVTGERGTLRSFARIRGACVYVAAFAGDVPVAVGMGVRDGRLLGVFDLFVHPDYRRSHWGSRVLAKLLLEGRRLGAERAYAYIAAHEAEAASLLRAFEFTVSHEDWYRIKV